MTNSVSRSRSNTFKALDNGGVTSSGGLVFDLFAYDAQVYFPKWGVAKGREQIEKLFANLGSTLNSSLLRSELDILRR
jgi:hypothetical protein